MNNNIYHAKCFIVNFREFLYVQGNLFKNRYLIMWVSLDPSEFGQKIFFSSLISI